MQADPVDQIVRTGGSPIGFIVREPLGRDQAQAGQAHRLHRPRRGADVARMPRGVQHDAHAGQSLEGRQDGIGCQGC